MEKLSSILPTSSRVASVDLDEAPPARPGAPTFGRKEGISTVRDRVTLQEGIKNASAETLYGRNPKDAAHAKMVEDLSRKFFNTRLSDKQKDPVLSEKINQEMNSAVNNSSIPLTSSMGDRRQEAVSQYEQTLAAAEPTENSRLSIEA